MSKRNVHRVKTVTAMHRDDMKRITNRTAKSSSGVRYMFGHGGEQFFIPRKEYLNNEYRIIVKNITRQYHHA